MLRRIWQAITQWFRRLFGLNKSTAKTQTPEIAPAKPLSDADYEYLFMQLLEGVEHGWNQGRVNKFFDGLKHRATEEQWVEWLRTFGERVLASPAPNRQLALGMLQLGELGCGKIGEVAYEIGSELISRQSQQQMLSFPAEGVGVQSDTGIIEYDGLDRS